jgi:hypothetical protein
MCVEGRTYVVLRAPSVNDEFVPIASITATDTGFMAFEDPAAGEGNEYFYRVVQQP